MNDYNNPKLTKNARVLRKNMTKEERKLWYAFLKNLPYSVNRQKVIGEYIVDFYCAKAKLIIELDGSQHFEEKGKLSDTERDEFFKSLGIDIVRYTNIEINRQFESVCQDILMLIDNINTSSVN